jgi:hypothetical protein
VAVRDNVLSGKSVLFVRAVTVVCCSESYCTECYNVLCVMAVNVVCGSESYCTEW